MPTLELVERSRYQDSVTLMQLATRLREIEELEEAQLVMGTPPNKELLHAAGLLGSAGAAAGPNDLLIVLRGSAMALQTAQERLPRLLQAELVSATAGSGERPAPRSLGAGLAEFPRANLVLISTPGLYAAAEARKALLQNRHVMIFSDNVTLEDEVELKQLAARRGLLLMGPDCGTAILGGVPLGFANATRRGPVGLVGASGTGMQELIAQLDQLDLGISHAIGTGSRDLGARVGGLMTSAGLRALLADPATSIVVLVSKPPHPQVAVSLLEQASRSDKPVVCAFLGASPLALLQQLQAEQDVGNLTLVATLEEAARRVAALAGADVPPAGEQALLAQRPPLQPQQRYVRGLFSGGTLCYEAMLSLRQALGPVYSNIPLLPDWRLEDPARSREHTCLDLGADEYTLGRPHPMLDHTLRVERLLQEAADPQVAVLLLDVVLGYGAHANPAAVLGPAIEQARAQAAAEGRSLAVVATICGTRDDPQGLEAQRQRLRQAGVLLAPGSAAAARLASAIVKIP